MRPDTVSVRATIGRLVDADGHRNQFGSFLASEELGVGEAMIRVDGDVSKKFLLHGSQPVLIGSPRSLTIWAASGGVGVVLEELTTEGGNPDPAPIRTHRCTVCGAARPVLGAGQLG